MTTLFIYYTKNTCRESISRKHNIVNAILSLTLTIIYVVSEHSTLLGDLSNKLFIAIILLVSAIGIFILIFYSFSFVWWLCTQKKTAKIADLKYPNIYKYFPLISFAVCILIWIPWFLYSSPGILTPDSINQLEQIVGLVPASNHHPYLHTLTIKLFYNIGFAITHTPNGGVAAYIIFQMIFLSFCAAFLIKTIQDYQCTPSYRFPLLVLAFYTLVPYNAVMSITLWKDALFGGITLLFSIMLFRCVSNVPGNHKILWLCLYPLSALAFCLFRSNGWYAFLLTTPFIIIGCLKNKRILILLNILVIITAATIRGPIMNHFGIEQPDFVESLCIPIQQIARTLVDDRELSDDEMEQIQMVIDPTYIHELYAPDFADNIKELVRAGDQQYLIDHKKDYMKLYLRMAMKYPADYFYAYVDQTYGYYNPTSHYSVADVEGIIENEVGVYYDPLIMSHSLLKMREILLKLQTIVPIYGSLWSMGCMLWFTLILFAISICKAKKETSASHWLPFIPVISLTISLMIATPVATEFRYAYGLFYTIPLLAFIALAREG